MFSMTKYHVLLNLREKTMVFWTLAFPLLLGVFFYFGIGGVDEASAFQAIPVAVIQDEDVTAQAVDGTGGSSEKADQAASVESGSETAAFDSQKIFAEFLAGISGELIEPEYGWTSEKAQRELEEGSILGIFDNTGEKPKVTFGKTGIEESILKVLMDGYEQQMGIFEDVQADLEKKINAHMSDEAAGRLEALAESMKNGADTEYVNNVSLGGREVSSIAPYYFALVAMACLYMCFLGETAAKRTQANISEIGKRISVSPAHRLKVVISNGISAYVIALVNMALIMLFLTKAVKGIDISERPGYAALTCMMGCLIGVSFGILIESIGKWSQNIKTAVLIGSSIFCAFLAGLMISSMKDIIEKHAPVINRLNPAALIADSFYCICVYDDLARLKMNLVIMGVMSILFLAAAWLMTRRVRYDSL